MQTLKKAIHGVTYFNNCVMENVALFLSTAGCFYLIFVLVIVPLFYQHPQDLVSWVQYIVQSIFQGVALPVLGYVGKKSGEFVEKILREIYDAVMEELGIVKEELRLAREQRDEMHTLMFQLQNEKR